MSVWNSNPKKNQRILKNIKQGIFLTVLTIVSKENSWAKEKALAINRIIYLSWSIDQKDWQIKSTHQVIRKLDTTIVNLNLKMTM